MIDTLVVQPTVGTDLACPPWPTDHGASKQRASVTGDTLKRPLPPIYRMYHLATIIQKYPFAGLYGHAFTQTINILWANYRRQDDYESQSALLNMSCFYLYSLSPGSGLPISLAYLNCPVVVQPEATGIVACTVKVGEGMWW